MAEVPKEIRTLWDPDLEGTEQDLKALKEIKKAWRPPNKKRPSGKVKVKASKRGGPNNDR